VGEVKKGGKESMVHGKRPEEKEGWGIGNDCKGGRKGGMAFLALRNKVDAPGEGRSSQNVAFNHVGLGFVSQTTRRRVGGGGEKRPD